MIDVVVSRLVTIGLFISFTILNWISFHETSFAQDHFIFEVRSDFSLAPGTPGVKDFYINVGSSDRVQEGMYVDVIRKIPVHDSYQNKSYGTLDVRVGVLKIIHVQKSMSIARLQLLFQTENRPMVDFEAIMIGDRIDLASLRMTPPKVKKTQSSAGTHTTKFSTDSLSSTAASQASAAPNTAPNVAAPRAPGATNPSPPNADKKELAETQILNSPPVVGVL